MRQPTHVARRARRFLLGLCAISSVAVAAAEVPVETASAPVTVDARKAAERSVSEWLMRIHDASRLQSYVGTFVVWSSGGGLSSARIWHACNGKQQVERLESLTGTPRSTFRRDDEVLTFMPESRLVTSERRDSLGSFPNLLQGGQTSIPDFYVARQLGSERVAGFDADVVQLTPSDDLRFGYRIWSEKKTGLAIKLQTLDRNESVLEQVAFSELRLDTGLRPDRLAQIMAVPEGWRLEKVQAARTTPEAEGWALKSDVAGFRSISAYKRPAEGAMQWVFSDGLASVSLFLEPYEPQRHSGEGVFVTGATHTLTQRIHDAWLTAVGEVPAQTLRLFAQNLEQRK